LSIRFLLSISNSERPLVFHWIASAETAWGSYREWRPLRRVRTHWEP
jgi:hypothetical protein